MRSYAALTGTVSAISPRCDGLLRNVMATTMPSGKPSADVVILGGGVIGLSVAVFASRAELDVRVIDGALPGGASRVAAGLLAASLGRVPPRAAVEFQKAN